jgi:opacity protein-like surface antigen
MKKIFILITISFLSLTGMASAQWFGEVRGIFPFDSDGSFDFGNVNSGEPKTAEDDHFGLGAGYKFENNYSVSLTYEKNDTNRIINNSSDTDGINYDHITDDLEIETYMMELAYNHLVNDKFSVIGLVGLGRSKHSIESEFLKFRVAGNNDRVSTNSRYGDDTETSTRIGLGGEYKTNEQISVVGMFTRTDYGTSQSYRTGNGNKSWGQEIEEDQFILGLRYNF